MRTIFFAALMLLWVSYALIAQNTLPDSVNFSTMTIPSIMQGRLIFSDTSYSNGRLFNIWNHGEGSPTNLNKYYRMQGSYNYKGHREIANPSVCFSDTSYLQLLFGYGSRTLPRTLTQKGDANIAFGIALHYDACAPNRSRTVAGTNTSYQETYPDWTDPSGGAFGFLTRNSGTDSVFADNNKRRVYHPSTTSAGTLILSHPYPNDEMISNGSIIRNDEEREYWGKELWLSINLRRLDTVAGNANDTVLILRIPYTTKTGMGPLVTPTRYIVFDRVPHPTFNPVQIKSTYPPTTRGLNNLFSQVVTDSIIITRRMLPNNGTDITFSSHFNLQGDNNNNNIINGTENHFLWGDGLSISDTSTGSNGRIKRMEPEIIYKGNCSIALDWVRLETTRARKVLRGYYDTDIIDHINTTIERLRDGVGDYPTPNPWLGAYQGNIRWHRVWLLEEDYPRTYHVIGYLNHLFGGRGMSEAGYTTQWGFREFDDNGNAIDATDITGQWRAAQMRYYTEHYARETNIRECWRGDTYSVTGTNAAPFVWKSSATADTNIGLTRGYFGGASGNWYNWDNFSYSSLQNNIEYRYHQRWTPSSLANIEAFSCKYATDPFMLFDTKRMYLSSVWAAPQYYLSSGYNDTTISTCAPGMTCPRTAKLFNTRQNSGEELRFTQWFARVLCMKGQATWSFQAKAIASSWQDSLVLPSPINRINYVEAWKHSYLGPHSYLQIMAQPPDTATNLSWYKNNSLGTDYLEINDPTRLDLFVPARSAIASTWGVQQDKIYFGRKTMRHELKKYQELTYTHDTTFARLDLDYWYGKGFRTFNTSRNGAKHNFFNRKIDTTKIFTRHIYFDTTLWKYSVSLPEPIDSSFCDITMLRDRTKNDTNEFYVGVLNRRLDPVFTIPIADTLNFGTTYADTTISTTKRYCFLPTIEFDSLLTLAAHPLIANKTVHRYCQFGAREITIPFKVSGRDSGDYPLLRIQEMGGTLDTVIGCDRPLAMKYLPGEGKIFRVRVQYPDRFTGDVSHSNQTKLVAHSIMRHDSVQNKWVEGDSVVYHAVYHKKIVGASARTGVYYRVSKPIAMASNTNALQWHNEILLSDSVEHHNRINLNDNCAYPALIVRFDSTMNTYNSFIVYGCTSSYSGDVTPFTGQHIVESIVALRRDTIINKSHGVSLDTVHSNVLSDYGTPMINASDSVNFYVYSCAQRGIIAGWKKPRVIDRFLVNTVNFRFTHPLNCYDPVFDARHPSMNPYSRYLRGQKENDCIVVWQEKNTCVPRENIFTTRLRVQNGTIVYGLSPNFDIPTPYSVLFKHDSTIFCSSTMTQSFDTVLSHHFPVVYRELWHADDSSAYCHFQTYYPGHTTTDFHLDRVVWEVHQGGSAVNFLSDRGHWFYDTTIAGTMQPNRFGVGWLGHLWMGAYSYPMPISPPASLDQPSISAGTAAYFKDYPPVNWYGCVNSYTQRAMNLTFRHQAGGVTSIFSLPQTHAYPPIREFVQMIDHNNVTQSHVAARGSVLLNDWWRNHRIYNKTVDNGIVLDPYQIRSSGQHYYRFGQGNPLRSLSVASFGNENGSFGIGTPSINDEEYMLYPYSTLPQRMEHPYYQTIDTLATAWFRVGDDEQLRYSFSGSNPQQATAYLERKSDGAQWILPSMPLREYTLSRLDLTLFNGNEEEYRIVTYGNENTSFIRNTALVYDNEEMSKISCHTLTLNLDELPMQQQSIRLYPNPANDELSVVWSGGKATVEILDSQGLTVFSSPMTTSVTLSTKELSSGVYMVRLKQGLHTQSMSVIVLH